MANSLWILSADLRRLNPQWFIVPGHVNDVLQILSTCYRIFLHGNWIVGRILNFSCKFCKSHSKSAAKSTCSTRRFCCEFPPCVNLTYAEFYCRFNSLICKLYLIFKQSHWCKQCRSEVLIFGFGSLETAGVWLQLCSSLECMSMV